MVVAVAWRFRLRGVVALVLGVVLVTLLWRSRKLRRDLED
jgi:hypothetical protein